MQGVEGLTAKAAEAIAQRDAVQANLLELDGIGKRMLDGAALTGETRRRREAGTRIANLRAAAGTARAGRRDAAAAWQRAAARIAGIPPLPEDFADPPPDALTALAAARTQTLDTERIVASVFAQRDQQAIAREGQRR